MFGYENGSSSQLSTLAALLAAGAAFFAVTFGSPVEADACGGFFCNQSQPINQADENIVFSSNGDGTVTAIIQIRYQGPSEKFAWLLPVPGKPDVGVSSSTVFQRLTGATNPNYNRDVTVEGTCKQPERFAAGGANGSRGADAGAAYTDSGQDSVNVVDSGSVGPYDYTTISVNEKADNPAKDALDWLKDNGYDLTNTGPELIREYLEDNMNLIAFKLTKNAQSGDIRPVKLTYEHPLPMIPLKLTAVAARENMGVRVWVTGKHRAHPTRFESVQLNPAAVNWFNWRSNYDQLITEAANEVGGKAFVTEYAGGSEIADGSIFSDNAQSRWENFNDASNWTDQEGQLLFQTLRQYGQWDGMLRVIRNEVPLPEEVTPQQFARSPFSVYDGDEQEIPEFDPAAYLKALDKNVVGPVKSAEKLVQSRSYLTRMYTTISPDEMVEDPTFDFSEKLPDVSNSHTAEQTIYCSEQVTRFEAPWKMELPDGTVVWGEGRNWPFGTDDISAAKESKTFEMGSGTGEIDDSYTKEIESTVENHNATVDKSPNSGAEGGCSCSSTSNDGPPLWVALVGLGLLALRRRRR